jgi:Ca-activated chloride channel homolog
VHGLMPDEFEITDGGSRREVAQFAAERAPVSLGILLDISGSMAADAKARAIDAVRWADTERALQLLVTRLEPRDEVFFSAFSDKVGLAVSWTREHERVSRAFSALRPGGYTALFDAVRLIAPAFQRAEHTRKVLLVISDGRDSLVPHLSSAPVHPDAPTRAPSVQMEIYQRQKAQRDAAIGAAQRVVTSSGAALYSIGMGTGIGAYVDLENLESLTGDSGGYVEAINDPSDISAAVARIFDELQSQYMLAFEPAYADGKYHDITVSTRNRDLRVRARAGYTAPERK